MLKKGEIGLRSNEDFKEAADSQVCMFVSCAITYIVESMKGCGVIRRRPKKNRRIGWKSRINV